MDDVSGAEGQPVITIETKSKSIKENIRVRPKLPAVSMAGIGPGPFKKTLSTPATRLEMEEAVGNPGAFVRRYERHPVWHSVAPSEQLSSSPGDQITPRSANSSPGSFTKKQSASANASLTLTRMRSVKIKLQQIKERQSQCLEEASEERQSTASLAKTEKQEAPTDIPNKEDEIAKKESTMSKTPWRRHSKKEPHRRTRSDLTSCSSRPSGFGLDPLMTYSRQGLRPSEARPGLVSSRAHHLPLMQRLQMSPSPTSSDQEQSRSSPFRYLSRQSSFGFKQQDPEPSKAAVEHKQTPPPAAATPPLHSRYQHETDVATADLTLAAAETETTSPATQYVSVKVTRPVFPGVELRISDEQDEGMDDTFDTSHDRFRTVYGSKELESEEQLSVDSLQTLHISENQPECGDAGETRNKKAVVGRFYTHPVTKESQMRETGALDSNGLGSLRDGFTITGSYPSAVSRCSSLDSSISLSPGHTADEPSLDVIAETVERHGSRKGKPPKLKSKSDPGAAEHIEGELNKSGQSQTQSSPVLSDSNMTFEFSKAKDTHLGPEPMRKSRSVSPVPRKSRSPNKSPNRSPVIKPLKNSSRVSPKHSPNSHRQNRKQRRGDEQNQFFHTGPPFPATHRKAKQSETSDNATPTSPMTDEVFTDVKEPESTIDSKSGNSSKSLTLPSSNIQRVPTAPSLPVIRKTPATPRGSQVFTTFDGVTQDDMNMRNSQTLGRLGLDHYELGLSTYSLRSDELKETRELILEELLLTERQYVDTLHMLVEKYMIPMKTDSMMESYQTDDIFYKINEIYMHHATFLAFLEVAMGDIDALATVARVLNKTFSKQTVIDSYMSFIENFPRAEKTLDEYTQRSTFQRFVEQIDRVTRNKLPLKAQIVKPAQRIPRYELLLKRLMDHTTSDPTEHELLAQAQTTIHQLALRINSVKEAQTQEDMIRTLKTLELLLITDLVTPERIYIRHDFVQVMTRKDQCCLWLLSDLLMITGIKRKTGTINRKSTLLLQSPTGPDYVENSKHKVWLKVSLDDVTITPGSSLTHTEHKEEKKRLEDDFAVLHQISSLSNKLQCDHQLLDDTLNDLIKAVNKQLADFNLKSPPPDANVLELVANTGGDETMELAIVFPTPEKRNIWRSALHETKQKLEEKRNTKPPDFMQALPISKTRAGMQFSCAAQVSATTQGGRNQDIWICHSDGYVGHVCLLNLNPEPIIALNTLIPGCTSRIICMCSVPAAKANRRRPPPRPSPQSSTEKSFDESEDSNKGQDRTTTDSPITYRAESSDEEPPVKFQIDADQNRRRKAKLSFRREKSSRPPLLKGTSLSELPSLAQSTMWLGTEDGFIHIFLSRDNIKTSKNNLVRVQQTAGVLCIVYHDELVFISLANGEVIVYNRNPDGSWMLEEPVCLMLGTSSNPISCMASVGGAIWCAQTHEILILDPHTYKTQTRFASNFPPSQWIHFIAPCSLGAWVASKASSNLYLYHSTTQQCLHDLNVLPAVTTKLQNADDIIRQHKLSRLRVTSLVTCRDLLWVGTSAGVVLNVPLPKQPVPTPVHGRSSPQMTENKVPEVLGLDHGHTGHVRFLAHIDVSKDRIDSRGSSGHVVVCGGEGLEDFTLPPDSPEFLENIGKDDSTNYLIVWQS